MRTHTPTFRGGVGVGMGSGRGFCSPLLRTESYMFFLFFLMLYVFLLPSYGHEYDGKLIYPFYEMQYWSKLNM